MIPCSFAAPRLDKWGTVGDVLAKPEAEVQIEQGLHFAAVTSCLSRSAAYSRQARMSSSVSSGIRENLGMRHARGQASQNIGDGDADMADAWARPPRFPDSIVITFW